MKPSKNIYILLFCTLLSIACGEDRTYQYMELTQENQWIFSEMKGKYLWSDSIKTPSENKFFGESSSFYKSLLVAGDKTSYFTDSASSTSYGIDYALMRDPLGIKPGKMYALVLFVEPGSAADAAGVKRGMWISRVGNSDLSSSNHTGLLRGNATTLCTWYIDIDDENAQYQWVAGDTLQMAQATEITHTAVYMDSIYRIDNRKAGYIVYNRFDAEAADRMAEILSRFQSENISDLIIDLRYNSGGSLNCAAEITGMIAPQTAGDTFCNLAHNNANSDKDTAIKIPTPQITFQADAIYLLVTASTRGTAEAFVNALRNSIDGEHIRIIGDFTAGENMYTEAIESPYGFTINPTVGQLYAANEPAIPDGGIQPDYLADELSQLHSIYPLGEKQEYMLYYTMYTIQCGTPPPIEMPIGNDAIRRTMRGASKKSIER